MIKDELNDYIKFIPYFIIGISLSIILSVLVFILFPDFVNSLEDKTWPCS